MSDTFRALAFFIVLGTLCTSIFGCSALSTAKGIADVVGSDSSPSVTAQVGAKNNSQKLGVQSDKSTKQDATVEQAVQGSASTGDVQYRNNQGGVELSSSLDAETVNADSIKIEGLNLMDVVVLISLGWLLGCIGTGIGELWRGWVHRNKEV